MNSLLKFNFFSWHSTYQFIRLLQKWFSNFFPMFLNNWNITSGIKLELNFFIINSLCTPIYVSDPLLNFSSRWLNRVTLLVRLFKKKKRIICFFYVLYFCKENNFYYGKKLIFGMYSTATKTWTWFLTVFLIFFCRILERTECMFEMFSSIFVISCFKFTISSFFSNFLKCYIKFRL